MQVSLLRYYPFNLHLSCFLSYSFHSWENNFSVWISSFFLNVRSEGIWIHGNWTLDTMAIVRRKCCSPLLLWSLQTAVEDNHSLSNIWCRSMLNFHRLRDILRCCTIFHLEVVTFARIISRRSYLRLKSTLSRHVTVFTLRITRFNIPSSAAAMRFSIWICRNIAKKNAFGGLRIIVAVWLNYIVVPSDRRTRSRWVRIEWINVRHIPAILLLGTVADSEFIVIYYDIILRIVKYSLLLLLSWRLLRLLVLLLRMLEIVVTVRLGWLRTWSRCSLSPLSLLELC